MINTDKAYNLINKSISCVKKTHKVNIKKSIGLYLAEDVKSNINIPPQDNSAVDGFAINFSNHKKNLNKVYDIVYEINAGDILKKKIKFNQCVKVSTGAHLPKHLDTVVMLEDVEFINKNQIKIKNFIKKKNVRKKGEDIKKGKIVLSRYNLIRPQEVGLLSSINKKEIKVLKNINIAVLSNGNELVNPGNLKKSHQIYDSNRFMLMALLNKPFIKLKDCGIIKDESCGQCTPCRNGTSMAVKLMEQKDWDIELLNKLSITMNKASICGLGQAAPNPLQCIIKYFEEDLK